MKNLFIVASPLQFINCIEAKNKFNTKENILILMYNSVENELDKNQKLSLLNKSDWDEVIYYDQGKIPKKKRFFEQVKLIKKLKMFKYDYIFSGEDGIFNRVLFANLNHKELFLVDDGTATIFTYQKELDGYFNSLSFSSKLRYYRYLLLGLKFEKDLKINFFTVYNLNNTKNISVVQNSYEFLKQKINRFEIKDTIYFLGQAVVEASWITLEKYIDYIKRYKLANKDKKIVYIPHRSEKITKEYKALEDKDFIIQPSKGAIEILFIEKQIYPKKIVSFISSALFNLDKIFPKSKIESILIDYEELQPHPKKIFKECYEFFKDTNVKLIKL